MVAEAIAGLSAIKTAFDIAKGLKDIDDAARRNAAVIELQERILIAQQTQSELLDRIRQLEKEKDSFESWETEKEQYELQEIYPRSFAYAIKAAARGSRPAHLICANCYEHRKKSILQRTDLVHLICPECKTIVQIQDAPVRTRRSVISAGFDL